jgi:predicted RNase H-like HicB family nuclease
MADRGYPVVVHALSEEDGGGYVAVAPDLYGCMADGDTAEAAIVDLHQAIEEWVDEAERLGREVPKPGEYAVRKHQERKEINDLLRAQEKLIKEQDRRLKETREEIEKTREEVEKIREGVSSLLEQDTRDEKSAYTLWASAALPLIANVMSRRRQDRLPN